MILGELTAAATACRKLRGMSVASASEVARLSPPYPSLAGLGPSSLIALQLARTPDSVALAGALRRHGAARVEPLENGSLSLKGELGRLLQAIAKVTSEGGDSPAARALEKTLGHLSRPAPELRLGRASWRFGERTYVLGIVNVTPDSFSGDGVGSTKEAAVERARALVAAGADALDVGGESSRPGHHRIDAEEEISRVVPALRAIAAELAVPLFVDTSKAEVAAAALAAGAVGVNDIWGLRGDPAMAEVVAASGAPVICMHNHRGTEYRDLVGEVQLGLRESIRVAEAAGVAASQVIIDPGIGFGKIPAQNFEVLRRLVELRTLGCAVLVGTSRKSLIGWALDRRPVEGRLLGTAATVAWAIGNGADIVRVHDVGEIRDVARVIDLLARRAPAG